MKSILVDFPNHQDAKALFYKAMSKLTSIHSEASD
jgi:hypothetical protein